MIDEQYKDQLRIWFIFFWCIHMYGVLWQIILKAQYVLFHKCLVGDLSSSNNITYILIEEQCHNQHPNKYNFLLWETCFIPVDPRNGKSLIKIWTMIVHFFLHKLIFLQCFWLFLALKIFISGIQFTYILQCVMYFCKYHTNGVL